jgi:hypothetical protein
MSGSSERRRRPDGGREGRSPGREGSGRRGPGPEFFLAVFQSGVREARIYRAYPDRDGVSFLYAGPAVLFLDVEVARGKGQGDWKAKAAQSLKTGLVSAGGAGLVGLAVLIAVAGRLALQDLSNATDLIAMVPGFVAIFAVAIVLVLTMSVRRITQRLELIDSLSPEQLREEAQSEKWSFRATADNVKGVVRIDPHDGSGGRPGSAARLSFRHDPTGKWKLILVARKDARAAVRAFREVLGDDGVEVNLSLKGD